MKVLVIIPARYGSRRFPGKMLADLNGKSVIQRTLERCREARLPERVLVATDDERIQREVAAHGGEGVLTASSHKSGTERCAEAYEKLGEEWDVVIDVQGDEPFIRPEQIDALAELFRRPGTDIGTLGAPMPEGADRTDPNRVKLVFGEGGHCLYFSRAPIPYRNDSEAASPSYQHIGIYGFRGSVLPELSKLSPTPLERSEGLEQLRWLEHGYRIRVTLSSPHPAGIDSPEDLEGANARIQKEEGEKGRNGSGSS